MRELAPLNEGARLARLQHQPPPLRIKALVRRCVGHSWPPGDKRSARFTLVTPGKAIKQGRDCVMEELRAALLRDEGAGGRDNIATIPLRGVRRDVVDAAKVGVDEPPHHPQKTDEAQQTLRRRLEGRRLLLQPALLLQRQLHPHRPQEPVQSLHRQAVLHDLPARRRRHRRSVEASPPGRGSLRAVEGALQRGRGAHGPGGLDASPLQEYLAELLQLSGGEPELPRRPVHELVCGLVAVAAQHPEELHELPEGEAPAAVLGDLLGAAARAASRASFEPPHHRLLLLAGPDLDPEGDHEALDVVRVDIPALLPIGSIEQLPEALDLGLLEPGIPTQDLCAQPPGPVGELHEAVEAHAGAAEGLDLGLDA
eukprot:CAMPEP_0176243622 /NCGR_PEP_ID=MMETSP0121_2-20121125/31017_1 /TAXON_ID=160619 /ORGANISM="Kryptoperidinium foliaceum, Strain CCMP 1326" /LENGTH=368 /DNA_ID=CAMNT_0017583217 /DNA_START=81 /DNA_END=1189 /DNA_ORIENTATION=-